MQVQRPSFNKIGMLGIGLLLVWLLWLIPPTLLVKEEQLLEKLNTGVESYFASRGLTLEIGKINWQRWNTVTASSIKLSELERTTVPVSLERLTLKLDLFALLGNIKNPAAALREIWLVKPKIELKHNQVGSWNFTDYFKPSGQQQSTSWKLRVGVTAGQVRFDDYQYGSYLIKEINGLLDLEGQKAAVWKFEGQVALENELAWSSSGQFDLAEKFGMGKVSFQELPLALVDLFLPETFPYGANSGLADAQLQFIWQDQKFSLQSGQAVLQDVQAVLPQLEKPLQIQKLIAEFSPEAIEVTSGKISYGKARLAAVGSLNPLSKALTMDLKVNDFQIQDLQEVFPQLTQLQLQGEADLQLKLTGTSDQPVVNGTGTLVNGSSNSPAFKIHKLSAGLVIADNNLSLKHLTGNYLGGTVRASGTIKNIFNPVYDLALTGQRLELEKLPFSFTEGLEITPVAFEAQLQGSGIEPQLSGTVALERVSYRDYQLDQPKLNFNLDLAQKIMHISEFTTVAAEGQLVLRGDLLWDKPQIAWDLAGELHQLKLDSAEIAMQQGVEGIVSAEVTAKGSWKPGESFNPGKIFGIIKADELLYQGINVDGMDAIFSWQERQLHVDSLRLDVANGRVFGSLFWDGTELRTNLSVEEVRLKELTRYFPDYPADGVFQGNVVVSGPLTQLKGRLVGDFTDFTWLGRSLGSVAGEVVYDDSVLKLSRIIVSSLAGDLIVKGKMGLAAEVPLDLEISGPEIALEEFAPWFPGAEFMNIRGDGKVAIQVTGTTVDPEYQGKVELTDFGFRELLLKKGHLEFHGDLKQMQITKFKMYNDKSQMELKGIIDNSQLDFKFQGHLAELDKLGLYYQGNLAQGEVHFQGRASGLLTDVQLETELLSTDLSYGNFKNQKLTAKVKLAYPLLTVESFRLGNGSSWFEADGTVGLNDGGQWNLGLKLSQIDLSDSLQATGLNNFAADGKISGEVALEGTFDNPRFRIDGKVRDGRLKSIPFEGELQLVYYKDYLAIKQIKLFHDQGLLQASGTWENGEVLRINAWLNNFPIDIIPLLIGSQFDLEGLADADLRLEWSKMGIVGEYNARCANLVVRDQPLGQVQLSGNYSEQGVLLTAGELALPGGRMNLRGYLPWPDEFVNKFNLPVSNGLDQGIDLKGYVRNLPTDVLNAISPKKFTVDNGSLRGHFTVKGNLGDPVISGQLRGEKARLNLLVPQVVVDDLQAVVTITDNLAKIEKASGKIKNEGVTMTGTAAFKRFIPAEVDLDLNGSKVYYNNKYFEGYGKVALNMKGHWKKPLISGKVDLFNAQISLASGSGSKPYWQPEFDLQLKAGKHVRYYQKGIADVDVTGELNFSGTLVEPTVSGKLTTKKGVLTLYGQNFMVRQGMANFNPKQGFLPYLDLESSFRMPQQEIFLNVKGQVGADLQLLLSAQPHLSQSEIYALLNWPETSGENELDVNKMIGGNLGFVTHSIFGEMLNDIRTSLHLDYLYLDADYLEKEFRINLGDYVTDKLFLSYSRSVLSVDAEEDWGLDYDLTSKLRLGGRYSDLDGTSWRMTYGFDF